MLDTINVYIIIYVFLHLNINVPIKYIFIFICLKKLHQHLVKLDLRVGQKKDTKGHQLVLFKAQS